MSIDGKDRDIYFLGSLQTLISELNIRNGIFEIILILKLDQTFCSIGLSQLPHGPRLGSESWVMIIHLHGADEEGVR